METQTAPHITHVERMRSGVVVTFADGRCSLFSDSLLHATLPRAEDLTHVPNPDEEDFSPSGETIVAQMTDYIKLRGRSSLKDGHSLTNSNELSIVAVDRYNGDQLYVSFSDGTFAVYTVKQLATLIPERMKAEPESPKSQL